MSEREKELEARIAELEEGLRKYGNHVPTCQSGLERGLIDECRCGLDALLQQAPASTFPKPPLAPGHWECCGYQHHLPLCDRCGKANPTLQAPAKDGEK